MSSITTFCLAYLFLLNVVTAQDSLYKRMLFPASNSSWMAYDSKIGVFSKIQCAGFCNLNSSKCRAFFYNGNKNICKLMDFNLSSNFEGENVYGYVDLNFLEYQYANYILVTNLDNHKTWQNKIYQYFQLTLVSTNLECLAICIGVEKETCDFYTFQNGNCYLGSLTLLISTMAANLFPMSSTEGYLIKATFKKFALTYFNASNNYVSSDELSRLMYKQLNLKEAGSLLKCFSICYFDENCKVLVFEQPFCLLGDPLHNETIFAGANSEIVYGHYDGMWSSWSEWSSCSTTCDSGVQTKSRQCNIPSPKFGGRDCLGNNTESKACLIQNCCKTTFDGCFTYNGNIASGSFLLEMKGLPTHLKCQNECHYDPDCMFFQFNTSTAITSCNFYLTKSTEGCSQNSTIGPHFCP